MLSQDPHQDRQLISMASWELEGLSFGIHQLEKVFRGEPKLFLGLRNLDFSVKFAHDYVSLMYGIDRLIDQHPIRIPLQII